MRLAGALLLAALVAVPAGNLALAQAPPGESVTLVNEGEEFVERKKDGRFVARPVFDREIDLLYYAVRHPDSGDLIAGPIRVKDGAKRLAEGWEYAWEYEKGDEYPELDPELGYLMAMVVEQPAGSNPQQFHTIIPIHLSTGLMDRVVAALEPSRWARTFARWIIEGVHGTLCGVVERATGTDVAECGEG